MASYNKPYYSTNKHIDQWKKRGLIVNDQEKAEHYLRVISYYRLSAYTLPYQEDVETHKFKNNIEFDNILSLYVFDRKLRLLLLDAIERIEVAFRASIINVLAKHHGPHAYLDSNLFYDKTNTEEDGEIEEPDKIFTHKVFLQKIKRNCDKSSETFIRHYLRKYDNPSFPDNITTREEYNYPPIWMAMEILTFKEVSLVFSNLKIKEDKQAISQYWELPDTVLKSWFRSLSDLRNICAHHARTWNREYGSRPVVPRKKPLLWPDLTKPLGEKNIDSTKRIYIFLVIIRVFIRKINPASTWPQRLHDLINKYSDINLTQMGIPHNWNEDKFWELSK